MGTTTWAPLLLVHIHAFIVHIYLLYICIIFLSVHIHTCYTHSLTHMYSSNTILLYYTLQLIYYMTLILHYTQARRSSIPYAAMQANRPPTPSLHPYTLPDPISPLLSDMLHYRYDPPLYNTLWVRLFQVTYSYSVYVYMCMVQVWKSVITNTPRTLMEVRITKCIILFNCLFLFFFMKASSAVDVCCQLCIYYILQTYLNTHTIPYHIIHPSNPPTYTYSYTIYYVHYPYR